MPDTDAARLGLAMAMLSRLVAGHAAGVVHPADWDAARAMVRGWEGGSAAGFKADLAEIMGMIGSVEVHGPYIA